MFKKIIRSVSKWAAIGSIGIIVAAALADFILARIFKTMGLPESIRTIEHAMLALSFFSAAYASCEEKHLTLNGEVKGKLALIARPAKSFMAIMIHTILFFTSISCIALNFGDSVPLFKIPIQVFVVPMALGFLLMAIFEAYNAKSFAEKICSAFGALFGIILGLPAIASLFAYFNMDIPLLFTLANAIMQIVSLISLPLILAIIALAFMGLPLFLMLAGVATILYLGSFQSTISVTTEAYNLLKNSALPAIPLFTIAGYLLSETGAAKRLVTLFRELFGWLPGGEAFAAVLVCAFFTTFTGANGVTILALGGLLSAVLMGTGSYKEKDVHGLLTASSSIGLLFPPSIAIIVYFIGANFTYQNNPSFIGDKAFDMNYLFLGCILPGLLLTLSMGAAGIVRSIQVKAKRNAFSLRRSGKALITALPEVILPAIIFLLYFAFTATLTEIASFAIVYLLIVESLFNRSGRIKKFFGIKLSPAESALHETVDPVEKTDAQRWNSLIKVITEAMPVAGGVLLIIAMAKALSIFMVDAGVAETFVAWISSIVHTKWVFLLFLNLALLLVGCFMDIFSAILVVSPLVIPLGAAFGIHPVHLGVIFITNLTLGFLTPPIGMNLFLASYAFKKPVVHIFRSVLPYFIIQLAVLALITWVPWFSTVFLPK